MRGLIIKKKWLDLIFSGEKNWEIRGSNTNIRGKILLIESGSKNIVGECILESSIILDKEMINRSYKNHRIKNTVNIEYLKPHAWILRDSKKYNNPIPYTHPRGAVIWVKIGEINE